MKKQYVRYRLIKEESNLFVVEEEQAKPEKKETLDDKTVSKLLLEAGKMLSEGVWEASKRVFVVLKKIIGRIGSWIKYFITNILPVVGAATLKYTRTTLSWVGRMVKFFLEKFGKGFMTLWTGFASICCALLDPLQKSLEKTVEKNKKTKRTKKAEDSEKAKKAESVYAAGFRLNNRMIKILNESENNPGKISGYLNNYIEKSQPKCRQAYNYCIKNDVVNENTEVARMVGISTLLICGHPRSPEQYKKLQVYAK